MEKILIVADVKNGQLRKPVFELLAGAKAKGWPAEVLLVGSGVAGLADTLAGHGAAKVYLADDAALAQFQAPVWLELAVQAVAQAQATQVWFSVNESAGAVAPRLAARLGGAYAAGVTALEEKDGALVVTRPVYATKVVQQLALQGAAPKVVTFRSGAFAANTAQPTVAQVVKLAPPAPDARLVLKEVVVEAQGEVDLAEAAQIVAVGRGVKDTAGIDQVRPLAQLLGAGLGASRAMVDAGFMPHATQIGQTGRTVTPEVYWALGISGAIQHVAGMSGSKCIVAVNKDPQAPIFAVADYGVVADLFKVVPVWLEEIKKAKG